jgi:flagellar protein FlgJ
VTSFPTVPAPFAVRSPQASEEARIRATSAPDRDQLKAAAEGFEAIFLGELLRGLRRTVPQSDEANTMGQTYLELFDERLAADIARKGGIGLATFIRNYVEHSGTATLRARR